VTSKKKERARKRGSSKDRTRIKKGGPSHGVVHLNETWGDRRVPLRSPLSRAQRVQSKSKITMSASKNGSLAEEKKG